MFPIVSATPTPLTSSNARAGSIADNTMPASIINQIRLVPEAVNALVEEARLIVNLPEFEQQQHCLVNMGFDEDEAERMLNLVIQAQEQSVDLSSYSSLLAIGEEMTARSQAYAVVNKYKSETNPDIFLSLSRNLTSETLVAARDEIEALELKLTDLAEYGDAEAVSHKPGKSILDSFADVGWTLFGKVTNYFVSNAQTLSDKDNNVVVLSETDKKNVPKKTSHSTTRKSLNDGLVAFAEVDVNIVQNVLKSILHQAESTNIELLCLGYIVDKIGNSGNVLLLIDTVDNILDVLLDGKHSYEEMLALTLRSKADIAKFPAFLPMIEVALAKAATRTKNHQVALTHLLKAANMYNCSNSNLFSEHDSKIEQHVRKCAEIYPVFAQVLLLSQFEKSQLFLCSEEAARASALLSRLPESSLKLPQQLHQLPLFYLIAMCYYELENYEFALAYVDRCIESSVATAHSNCFWTKLLICNARGREHFVNYEVARWLDDQSCVRRSAWAFLQNCTYVESLFFLLGGLGGLCVAPLLFFAAFAVACAIVRRLEQKNRLRDVATVFGMEIKNFLTVSLFFVAASLLFMITFGVSYTASLVAYCLAYTLWLGCVLGVSNHLLPRVTDYLKNAFLPTSFLYSSYFGLGGIIAAGYFSTALNSKIMAFFFTSAIASLWLHATMEMLLIHASSLGRFLAKHCIAFPPNTRHILFMQCLRLLTGTTPIAETDARAMITEGIPVLTLSGDHSVSLVYHQLVAFYVTFPDTPEFREILSNFGQQINQEVVLQLRSLLTNLLADELARELGNLVVNALPARHPTGTGNNRFRFFRGAPYTAVPQEEEVYELRDTALRTHVP